MLDTFDIKYYASRVLNLFLLLLFSFGSRAQTLSPLANGKHYASLNGVRLWYKVAGQPIPNSAPVLFLHGGPGYNSYSFEKTIGVQPEARMQIIYLDQRGSGRSGEGLDHNYSMDALVNDVEALRQFLNVPQLNLMGHSFGGTIALQYAARYPQSVQKLIVVDGASDFPVENALWIEELSTRYPNEGGNC